MEKAAKIVGEKEQLSHKTFKKTQEFSLSKECRGMYDLNNEDDKYLETANKTRTSV